MTHISRLALALALTFSLGLGAQGALAQTESATAEDGAPASEAPASTSTAPNVPIGANLTPPVGITPPVISPTGVGQSGPPMCRIRRARSPLATGATERPPKRCPPGIPRRLPMAPPRVRRRRPMLALRPRCRPARIFQPGTTPNWRWSPRSIPASRWNLIPMGIPSPARSTCTRAVDPTPRHAGKPASLT